MSCSLLDCAEILWFGNQYSAVYGITFPYTATVAYKVHKRYILVVWTGQMVMSLLTYISLLVPTVARSFLTLPVKINRLHIIMIRSIIEYYGGSDSNSYYRVFPLFRFNCLLSLLKDSLVMWVSLSYLLLVSCANPTGWQGSDTKRVPLTGTRRKEAADSDKVTGVARRLSNLCNWYNWYNVMNLY